MTERLIVAIYRRALRRNPWPESPALHRALANPLTADPLRTDPLRTDPLHTSPLHKETR